jgi:ATP-dependent DNA ligase
MDLPVNPPVAPMLAKPVDAIPDGDYVFEPKWDGFRSIVFRDGDEVEIGSRNERPMTRYFPELVAAVLAELPPRCVIDGEIVVPDASGRRLDFEALQLRIHRRTSSRSTCSRSVRRTTWSGRSPSAGPCSPRSWPGSAPPFT